MFDNYVKAEQMLVAVDIESTDNKGFITINYGGNSLELRCYSNPASAEVEFDLSKYLIFPNIDFATSTIPEDTVFQNNRFDVACSVYNSDDLEMYRNNAIIYNAYRRDSPETPIFLTVSEGWYVPCRCSSLNASIDGKTVSLKSRFADYTANKWFKPTDFAEFQNGPLMRYNVTNDVSEYALYYVNDWGTVNILCCNLGTEVTQNVEKESYLQSTFSNRPLRHELLSQTVYNTIKLKSHLMRPSEVNYHQQILRSPRIYLRKYTGETQEVVLKDTSFKSRIATEQLVQFTLEVETIKKTII